MIKVAHVINALSIGGAETMLLKLLTHADRRAFAPRVYTLLSPAGAIGAEIARLGIEVGELGMRRGTPNPVHVARLARWFRQEPPDLIQTWMYHSDLVGGLAARLSGLRVPVVWNIRNSTLDPSASRRRTFWVVSACARLSARLPDAIVCCSSVAAQVHASIGYDATKFVIIPNGFDVAVFRPNPTARVRLRRELGLIDDVPLVGLVARFDPQKDHSTFVAAAATLHADRPDVHFILCGRGADHSNAALIDWIASAGLASVCHLLGERADMPTVNAALDVATSSSSFGEAFPNSIGEAMACGIPCVVTDVGDAAHLVGNTGRVVRTRDPRALADAWAELLDCGKQSRVQLGARARERVRERFSMTDIARAYEDTYCRVLAARGGRTRVSTHLGFLH